MNFSEAVRGSLSRPGKLDLIISSWETEFGQKMTDADKANLSKSYTLDETYQNVRKVIHD